jgi:hypothetical protein
MSRLLHLDAGVALVATDLHGDGQAYARLRDAFLRLHAAGQVDFLVLCGDVIHGYGPEEQDASLPILLDIFRLQAEYGTERVILLSGNHEVPHIYGMVISKGDVEFTARFEHALARLNPSEDGVDRQGILERLMALPFYLSTRAEVLISHAGASPAVRDEDSAALALGYDHAAVLAQADEVLHARFDLELLRSDRNYMAKARRFLAIGGPQDARLSHLLRAELIHQTSAEYRFLWELLFTENERRIGPTRYAAVTTRFIAALNAHLPVTARLLVGGHIATHGGHLVVNEQHLRLSTAAHAQPVTAGQVLLLDCGQPVRQASDLLHNLRDLSSL